MLLRVSHYGIAHCVGLKKTASDFSEALSSAKKKKKPSTASTTPRVRVPFERTRMVTRARIKHPEGPPPRPPPQPKIRTPFTSRPSVRDDVPVDARGVAVRPLRRCVALLLFQICIALRRPLARDSHGSTNRLCRSTPTRLQVCCADARCCRFVADLRCARHFFDAETHVTTRAVTPCQRRDAPSSRSAPSTYGQRTRRSTTFGPSATGCVVVSRLRIFEAHARVSAKMKERRQSDEWRRRVLVHQVRRRWLARVFRSDGRLCLCVAKSSTAATRGQSFASRTTTPISSPSSKSSDESTATSEQPDFSSR